jgi:hypothetical protein
VCSGGSDLGHVAANDDSYALVGEFVSDASSKVVVDGGEHLGESLDDGDVEVASREGIGDFAADIAGADDGDASSTGELFVDGEGLGHGVKCVDTVEVDPGQRRAGGFGSGRGVSAPLTSCSPGPAAPPSGDGC